jgi:hypothetical protein
MTTSPRASARDAGVNAQRRPERDLQPEVDRAAQLREDDCFYSALYKPGAVRDHARAVAERCPDGRMPDGRRIVHTGLAA